MAEFDPNNGKLTEQQINDLVKAYDAAVAETSDHEPDLNIQIEAKPGQDIQITETKVR